MLRPVWFCLSSRLTEQEVRLYLFADLNPETDEDDPSLDYTCLLHFIKVLKSMSELSSVRNADN